MKIGIVGARIYENKKKIKDFIFKLVKEHGDDLVIISGGCKDGADKYAKKYALELGAQYHEYPPAHFPHNLYCPLGEHNYGKQYHVKNYFARNKLIAKHSDYVVGFIPEGHISKGTNSTLTYAQKFGKKTLIID